ncbi:MAG: Cysteine--tRNA ligase [Candidatus Lokiarchaeum sp. GC14_75]|nr:MAG: Cysteine--tRNA ligase [Candidatus Lokiarchaeum sp. GC14_75]
MLKIFNTMTREKEVFTPLEDGYVKIYTCGQTVYDDVHIGNARTYSSWDVVIRYLKYKGYHVFHVQNFTDVGHLTDDADQGEDKIEKRAREQKVNPWELVDNQIEEYWRVIDDLNINRPNISPRATSLIPEMIELIEILIKKGYAYEVQGNVYYDISKFKDYTKLSGIKLDEEQAKARVDQDPLKKNYFDFALWLNAKKDDQVHIMRWNSPWGEGYPGWHLECSVMAMKYLGETIDIHCGGIDHIPTHHPNEIAQSEAGTGKKFVNCWMHAEFITLNGRKMSKSHGNYFTARELIDEHGALTVRMGLVSGHYRSSVDWNPKVIENAKNNVEKIRNCLIQIDISQSGNLKTLNQAIDDVKLNFENAMDDDFNTPKALAIIYEFVKKINSALNNDKETLEKAKKLLLELLEILGLDFKSSVNAYDDKFNHLMDLIIKIRDKARLDKNYKISDEIRNQLKSIGIQLEDSATGQVWKMIS